MELPPRSAPISRTPTAAPSELGEAHTKYGNIAGGITFVSAPSFNRSRSRTSLNEKEGSIKCQLSDDHKVACFSDFWQPPVVRQWIRLSDGRLFREAEERNPSRYELFFDLLLVGVVHQLADNAAENVSGASVAKVALTFYPAWSIWADLRNWLNQSGVDDVAERIHTLIIMCCLIGYSANASAIEVGGHSESEAAAAVTSTGERLIRRVVHATAAEGVATTAVEEGGHGPQHALVAAVAFFLIAKLVRIATSIHYGIALPEFRTSHFGRALGLIIVSLIFMGIIWAPTIRAAAILAIFGIAVEMGGRLSIGVMITMDRRKTARLRTKQASASLPPDTAPVNADAEGASIGFMHGNRMVPAINIEHMEERLAAFVVVVLGESVVSLLYVASQGSFGASREYGRAVFALTVVFIYNALYFDASLSKRFVHAIRRHWFTHICWDIMHYPLCLALILASAAVAKMVKEESVPRAVRWQYGGGLGAALFCITLTGILHRSLDPKGAARLNQSGRAVVRSLIAIVFILIPIAKNFTDLQFLGTYAGIASALVLFELWAKIGEDIEVEDHHPVDVDAEDAREEEADMREADRAGSSTPTKTA